MSLLFVLLFVLMPWLTVSASSVGASGTFGGTNYTVQTGNSLIDTGTDFVFLNNFSTPVTVEFLYEAPLGVVIEVPSGTVVVAANSSYRILINITTTASTPVGTFPLRLVGRVIPDTTTGVEITGSAGLNASITVAGIAPTTAPELTVLEVTSTTFRVRIRNIDFDPIVALYELGNPLPTQGPIDLEPQAFIDVTFSNLEPNTIYTLFAAGRATSRPESIRSLEITTLPAPVTPPAQDPPDDEVVTPPPPPPPAPAPAPTPPSFGGGGSSVVNVLVIELEFQTKNLNVFEPYQPPQMNAYVSVRLNNRETSRIDVTNRVVITGAVNPNILGRYEIRYFLRYNTITLQEVVVVQVRDLEAPRILSPADITIKVDDPFFYQLIAVDNYNRSEDLIITGLPSNVDTSQVGVQRYSVLVADQSGNRIPFLFTVTIRARVVTPISILINDIELILDAVEGYFDAMDYRIDVAVASNQPLPNSPSWTVYRGQSLETNSFEVVYVRLTDLRGNTLFGIVDLNSGRVISMLPDDNTLIGDAWWQILFRGRNLALWFIPLLVVLTGWVWFFFLLAKRRKDNDETAVVYGPLEPPIIALEEPVVVVVKTPRPRKKPSIKAASDTPVTKPTSPRRPRKPKIETYSQLVAVEKSGVMDNETLGAEPIELLKKPPKASAQEDAHTAPSLPTVDENQIELFPIKPRKPRVKK